MRLTSASSGHHGSLAPMADFRLVWQLQARGRDRICADTNWSQRMNRAMERLGAGAKRGYEESMSEFVVEHTRPIQRGSARQAGETAFLNHIQSQELLEERRSKGCAFILSSPTLARHPRRSRLPWAPGARRRSRQPAAPWTFRRRLRQTGISGDSSILRSRQVTLHLRCMKQLYLPA